MWRVNSVSKKKQSKKRVISPLLHFAGTAAALPTSSFAIIQLGISASVLRGNLLSHEIVLVDLLRRRL